MLVKAPETSESTHNNPTWQLADIQTFVINTEEI